jgi:uncharacterized protein YutD
MIINTHLLQIGDKIRFKYDKTHPALVPIENLQTKWSVCNNNGTIIDIGKGYDDIEGQFGEEELVFLVYFGNESVEEYISNDFDILSDYRFCEVSETEMRNYFRHVSLPGQLIDIGPYSLQC